MTLLSARPDDTTPGAPEATLEQLQRQGDLVEVRVRALLSRPGGERRVDTWDLIAGTEKSPKFRLRK